MAHALVGCKQAAVLTNHRRYIIPSSGSGCVACSVLTCAAAWAMTCSQPHAARLDTALTLLVVRCKRRHERLVYEVRLAGDRTSTLALCQHLFAHLVEERGDYVHVICCFDQGLQPRLAVQQCHSVTCSMTSMRPAILAADLHQKLLSLALAQLLEADSVKEGHPPTGSSATRCGMWRSAGLQLPPRLRRQLFQDLPHKVKAG